MGTVKPTREFLYIKDAADGILTATERYDGRDPLNLGSGTEISIRELIERITDLTGFKGEVQWALRSQTGSLGGISTHPERRSTSTWEATTPLDDGLPETVDWYESHRDEIVEDGL